MKRFLKIAVVAFSLLVFVGSTSAHFGVILPSDDIIGQKDQKKITLKLYFMHPFEQEWLNMGRPKKFGVMIGDEKIDLSGDLSNKKIRGKDIWETMFQIKRPGDYIFYLEPEPYFEPAEEKFILHYPKVIVQALGKGLACQSRLFL